MIQFNIIHFIKYIHFGFFPIGDFYKYLIK